MNTCIRAGWRRADSLETGPPRPLPATEQTSDIWIGELSDLHGKRGDVHKLKNFASRKRDRARLAYGHKREERPCQFVLVATTNEDHPLEDVTGNRRYLMVRIVSFDIENLARDRDQLWAEAATIVGETRRCSPAPTRAGRAPLQQAIESPSRLGDY